MNIVQTHQLITYKLKRFLINIVFFLTLFPFFKLVPFLDAEVQPFSAIFASIYLLLFWHKEYKNIYRFTMPYIMVIICYFMLAIALAKYEQLNISDSIQSLIIFITPLITFIALFQQLNLISIVIFRIAIYTWFLTSLCQLYFPNILNATGASLILSLLISRFSAEKLSDWNRGVVGLSPEPSYAAHIILLILLFGIFIYRQQRIKKRELVSIISLSLFMVYANQSATMGFIIIIFLTSYCIFELIIGNRKSQSKLLLFIILGTILLSFTFLLFPEVKNIRLFETLTKLMLSISGNSEEAFDPIEFTNSLGSQRTISVNVGYLNLINTYGIGSGMGGWGTYFIDAMEKLGLEPSDINFFKYTGVRNIKPYAYGALVAFDLGLFGILSLSNIFIKLIANKILTCKKISAYAWSCLVLFIFGVYFNSPTSLEAYWIILLFFLEDGYFNYKKK